jgi:hypothetical protein
MAAESRAQIAGEITPKPEEGCQWQVVQAELDRFIELLFQDSEAYRLALKLYAGRYEVIAARDAADILREVIEKHMPEGNEQTQPEG